MSASSIVHAVIVDLWARKPCCSSGSAFLCSTYAVRRPARRLANSLYTQLFLAIPRQEVGSVSGPLPFGMSTMTHSLHVTGSFPLLRHLLKSAVHCGVIVAASSRCSLQIPSGPAAFFLRESPDSFCYFLYGEVLLHLGSPLQILFGPDGHDCWHCPWYRIMCAEDRSKVAIKSAAFHRACGPRVWDVTEP